MKTIKHKFEITIELNDHINIEDIKVPNHKKNEWLILSFDKITEQGQRITEEVALVCGVEIKKELNETYDHACYCGGKIIRNGEEWFCRSCNQEWLDK